MLTETGNWTAMAGLGAWHGLNPAMGWLFAVALGLQARSRGAVWRSFLPLAAGHAVAIAVALALAAAVGLVLPGTVLRWGVALLLVGYGVFRLVSQRHPRFGGMRMRGGELAAWSALMASAHGAGLMVVPFVLQAGGTAAPAHDAHAAHTALAAVGGTEAAALATLLHTLGYLLVAVLVAVLVYERLGLERLRRVWVNLDLIWAGTMIVTGCLTPLL